MSDSTAFEKFFTEEYGIRFVDVTLCSICPMTINCYRTGWVDGETECEGCGLEATDTTATTSLDDRSPEEPS